MMVLVDTSVWIQHFRARQTRLQDLLYHERVLIHPMVIGELACGRFKNRREVLGLLQQLPRAVSVADEEVLEFIENHRLEGTGLGWIDMHLLASALLSDAALWTLDRRLHKLAEKLAVVF